MKINKVVPVALAFVMGIHAMPSFAQSTTRDRFKTDKCYSADGKEISCDAPKVAEVAKYPLATRIAPEAPKTKIKKEWDVLVKASNAKDAGALMVAAKAVVDNPDSSINEKSEAYFQMYVAQVSLDPNDYAKLAEFAVAAINQNGLGNNRHYDLLKSVGLLKLNERKYVEALEYLDRFSRETGSQDDLLTLKNKGNAYYRLAKYPEAIAQLEKAYAIDKGADANIAVMLIDAYNKSGRKADANRLADEVAKAAAASGDPGAESKQLLVYANAKQYEKAAQAFDALYAKGQIATLAEYEAGYVSYSYLEGKEAQAIKIINEGISKGVIKPDAAVYNILGQSYYYSGNAAGAIDAWGKGAALSKDGEQDLLLARVLGEESEYAKSKAAAQLALSKGVQSKGDAYLIIAEAESEFGLDNRAAMISALKEAAKYPETQAEARKRLKQAGGN